MIQLFNASLSFGGRTILDNASWSLRPGQRIGLVGPNGAGKTTCLRVLMQRQPLDSGTLDIPGGTTIGYLEQDTQEEDTGRTVLAEAMRAFDEVLQLQAREVELTDALAADPDHTSAAYEARLHELDRVQTRLLALDAHTAKPRTEAVLTGLGFDPDDLERPLATFSGGWRMRVALARLLLQRPDFLLLDEPTNHLDIDSIDWLETYLKGYPGTVVVVSHDRYFLDRMVTHTVELVQGRATEYAGNYSFYLEERQERRALQQAAYDNQQKTIADMERFVERFRAKATKAKQAQSRVKALERMERLEPPPQEAATVHFRFPSPRRSGRDVLRLSRFSKTYHTKEGDVEVFKGADPLTVERGDKIALIGPNGAGKSTLARILLGSEPFEGERTMGHNVDLMYFAQHQADTLHPDDTILQSLQQVARGHTETELRSLAGAFLFKGDDVHKPVRVLSGGERSRVALARTMLSPANLLILDEPTNHLDMASISVLVEALQQYSGTFLVVSHDRHFLDQIAQQVWRVEGGAVQTFGGTYSEYRWAMEHGTTGKVGAQHSAPAPPKPTSATAPAPADKPAEKRSGGPKTKEQKRAEAAARAAAKNGAPAPKPAQAGGLSGKQLERAHADLEARILEKETEKGFLESRMASPDLYDDPEAAAALAQSHAALLAELKELYAAWEQTAEQLVG
jgi:ATP-binding cassette subfamily F protein 3